MSGAPEIVITGLGVVSPFGIGMERFSEGLRRGESAIRPLDHGTTAAGMVPDFQPEVFDSDYKFLRLPRITQLSVAATELAMREASLNRGDVPGESVGLFSGIMHGVMDQTEQYYAAICDKGAKYANPLLFQNTVPNAIVSELSLRFGVKGMAITISSGAASGLLAVMAALTSLRAGRIRTAIIIAAEELSSRTLGTYQVMRWLSADNTSRPFDARRNGMVLAEGAAALVLELAGDAEKRGITPRARILSAAASQGTTGRDGAGLTRAMAEALRYAGVSFRDVQYVAAAANSSRVLDRVESDAIREVAGPDLPNVRVSSIKAMIGESFSTSGLLNVAACVAGMNGGFIPPTVNYSDPDRGCDLPFAIESDGRAPRMSIANAASFGGNSASVILAG